MEYLKRFTSQVRNRVLLVLIFDNLIFLLDWWLVDKVFHLSGYELLAALIVAPILTLTVLPWLSTRYLTQPTKLISEAILHLAPAATGEVPTPDPSSAHFGKELVSSLIHQVYELATVADRLQADAKQDREVAAGFVAGSLPVPLLILNKEQVITYANEAAALYLGKSAAEMVGKNVYDILDMLFSSDETFEKWLKYVRTNSVTATKTWERVRMDVSDVRPLLLFDLAAYYNRDNANNIETMLVLFDHTKSYSQDDQAISFIALSVHELRTPLTLLRGYIEAFEEELGDQLDPQMKDFMFKMNATAQQLMAFVNNILNVARLEGDQLVLQLREQAWPDVVRSAANGLALRAKVRGITLEYSIARDLPSVGVDQVSIIEVINNLVDNAIKYSGDSKRIRLTTRLNAEGLVETTVQDFGVGISPNVMPNLFTKYYRDHHNRAQVGGTGLGLYLCKAIVDAHGGNLWVTSKLGEGSTFGFTLLPYSQLAAEQKNGDNKDIVRGAHGWIKNHSLYRR